MDVSRFSNPVIVVKERHVSNIERILLQLEVFKLDKSIDVILFKPWNKFAVLVGLIVFPVLNDTEVILDL